MPRRGYRFDLLEAVPALPGGEVLLAAATPNTYLVGGTVRDLLAERRPRELDVVVEGPLEPLLEALPGEPVRYGRFQTATVRLPCGAQLDLARSRRERYPRPGALPEVEPAPLGEDLLRRDFTVNALALGLAGKQRGRLLAVPAALSDLRAGRLRVLHRSSFQDDPTRLLRLARYMARLSFSPERKTAALAKEAVAEGALGWVSCGRLGEAVRLCLEEDDPRATVGALAALDLPRALGLAFPSPSLVEKGLSLLGPKDDPALFLGLALLWQSPLLARAPHALDRLSLRRSVGSRLRRGLDGLPVLERALGKPQSRLSLWEAVSPYPAEAVALAGASGPPLAFVQARLYLATLRWIKLTISGADLLQAGLAPGPSVGEALRAVLRQKVVGTLPDRREAELAAALAACGKRGTQIR